MADKTHKLRIVLVIIMLGVVTGFSLIMSNRQPEHLNSDTKQISMRQFFTDLPGWPGLTSIPLDEDIVRELKLDDYLYRVFGTSENSVTLYIGFYRKAVNVGAAHDPLVCFQGQGWRIVSQGKGYREVFINKSKNEIKYATMLAQRENYKELLCYWFQTHDKTANNTFQQKIDMIGQKLKGGNENNAFVRISAPVKDGALQETVQKRIVEFMDAFYPRFQSYLTESQAGG